MKLGARGMILRLPKLLLLLIFVLMSGRIGAYTAVWCVYWSFHEVVTDALAVVLYCIAAPMAFYTGGMFAFATIICRKRPSTQNRTLKVLIILSSLFCIIAFAAVLRLILKYGVLPPQVVLNSRTPLPTPVCLGCFSQFALATYTLVLYRGTGFARISPIDDVRLRMPWVVIRLSFVVVCGAISAYTAGYCSYWLFDSHTVLHLENLVVGSSVSLGILAGAMFGSVVTGPHVNGGRSISSARAAFFLLSAMCIASLGVLVQLGMSWGSSAPQTTMGLVCSTQYALAANIVVVIQRNGAGVEMGIVSRKLGIGG